MYYSVGFSNVFADTFYRSSTSTKTTMLKPLKRSWSLIYDFDYDVNVDQGTFKYNVVLFEAYNFYNFKVSTPITI